jgi:pimeloyl-ACP methyl ester carboxylesterase
MGSLYYLWRDASNPMSLALSTLKLGVGLLAHWEAHKAKAKKVGLDYGYPLLSSLPKRQITLMGFSLGARVAYYIMRGWPKTVDPRLKDIILLSGAVRRQADKQWSLHVENITGKLVNIYNEDDLVLAYVFKVPSLNRSPCGIKPIKEFHPRIENLNATYLIGSVEHSYKAYLPHLELLLDQKLDWKARCSRLR